MLIDSHCHLDKLTLTAERNLSAILADAYKVGVEYILCPAVDLEHFPDVLTIVKNNKNIVASVGVHPTETGAREPTLSELVELGDDAAVVGIGETGLDYYYCQNADGQGKNSREYQRKLFKLHIAAAKELGKPLIIHSRAASSDIIAILKSEQASVVGGVMHCFTENLEMMKSVLALDFYISLAGIVTFKNADMLREVAQRVPLDRLLIETDSPYLAPVPLRGKPNEPAYVHYIAEYIAKLRHISYQDLAQQTTENFFRLFGDISYGAYVGNL